MRMATYTKHLELLLKNMIFQCKSVFKPFVSGLSIDFFHGFLYQVGCLMSGRYLYFLGGGTAIHGVIPAGLLLLD